MFKKITLGFQLIKLKHSQELSQNETYFLCTDQPYCLTTIADELHSDKSPKFPKS